MLNKKLMKQEDFQAHVADAAKLMRVLANERRLEILCKLQDGEVSVGELQKQLSLSQSALSQHLALLRDENIVTTRRAAQSVFYRITDPAAVKIISTLAEIFCPQI